MDLKLIETFIVLADVKSFTKAAEQLFVAQSTITARVQELERELGKTLFIRERKNIQLTIAGNHYLQYAKSIIQIHETARDELSMIARYNGWLRIGSVHALYECHLRSRIQKFMLDNPSTAVRVIINHSENLLQHLHDGLLDIVFTYKPVNYPHLYCQPFQEDKFVFVTSPRNPIYPDGVTDDALRSLPILYTDFMRQSNPEWFSSVFSENHVFLLEIDIASHIIPYLLDGFGYSFVPEIMVSKYLETGELVEIKIAQAPTLNLQCYTIVNHKDSSLQIMQDWLHC